MLSRRLGASVTLLAVSAAISIACNEEGPRSQACYPGDVEYTDASMLADGASMSAFVQCNADGTAYEPLDAAEDNADGALDGSNGSDGSEAGVNCDLNAGLLGFMCPGCTSDDQCTTGRCVPFNNKGPHCSHACKTGVDCPYPSGGCGNNGFCKPQ
jgi:hypothetical protein